jgi:MoxR-like ATPase
MNAAIRLPVEQAYASELQALARSDDRQKPAGWSLSPQAVLTYLLGGKTGDGTPVTPKYVGRRRLMETAVATLATDRALLLLGVPGTAKSWVSEHLAAAIMGDSTLIVQCTAGTDENQIRYGWNYAQLLAKGPSQEALVPTPLYRAMQTGKLCRLEELTRMGSDVQDTLITVLSEKMMPIPELNTSIYAQRGFNIIATANNRDKGVNELSSALKRRFNVVVLPLPEDMAEEVAIVSKRVDEMAGGLDLPVPKNVGEEIARVLTIFRELRSGATADGKVSQAAWFDSGKLGAEGLAASLVGAIVKDPVQDKVVLEEYLETVLKKRPDYAGYYAALNAAI